MSLHTFGLRALSALRCITAETYIAHLDKILEARLTCSSKGSPPRATKASRAQRAQTYATYLFSVALLYHVPLSAQTYPEKPVRIVVPFSAGGPTDVLARLVAEKLTDKWETPVVIDNRPGAGANIGSAQVARASPDGYTLLFTTSALAAAPSVYKKLGYDPANDLLPISNVAQSTAVLVVKPNFEARTLSDLISIANQHPNQISYGAAGPGTPLHLGAELLKKKAGLDILYVPYKGSMPALSDLMGGHVALVFDSLVTSIPYIQSGKLRALAVGSSKRSLLLPDIPTVEEAGLAGYNVSFWYGVFAPAGTSQDIIEQINASIATILKDSSLQERVIALGAEPVANSVSEFKREFGSDLNQWAEIADAAGIVLR